VVKSIGLYTPFIKRFCTGLRMLTIKASEDPYFDEERVEEFPAWWPKNHQEAMVRLLERDILGIKTLNSLSVVTDGDMVCGYAEPVMKAIRERTRREILQPKKIRSKIEEGMGTTGDAGVECGFCKDDHLWVHCLNLCSKCWEYGHFGKWCLKTESERFRG
jgi:hypothetical protein